jgi:PAS domain-containing protein
MADMTNNQATLSARQELFVAAAEQSVDGFLVIDREGVVQFANLAAAALFADQTCQLVGLHLGVPASLEPVEIALPNGRAARHVEMRSCDIQWHDSPSILAILRDVTERKRSEERLERLDRTLRLVRNINKLILRERDPERVVQDTCNLLVTTRGYTAAWLWIRDAEGRTSHLAQSNCGSAWPALAERLTSGQQPPHLTSLTDSLVIHDASAIGPHCPVVAERERVTAILAPLRFDGTIRGALCAYLTTDRFAAREEQQLLLEIADDLAFALERIEASKRT